MKKFSIKIDRVNDSKTINSDSKVMSISPIDGIVHNAFNAINEDYIVETDFCNLMYDKREKIIKSTNRKIVVNKVSPQQVATTIYLLIVMYTKGRKAFTGDYEVLKERFADDAINENIIRDEIAWDFTINLLKLSNSCSTKFSVDNITLYKSPNEIMNIQEVIYFMSEYSESLDDDIRFFANRTITVKIDTSKTDGRFTIEFDKVNDSEINEE